MEKGIIGQPHLGRPQTASAKGNKGKPSELVREKRYVTGEKQQQRSG
jgi:hypothetical protein